MFNSIFTSISGGAITLSSYLICTAAALLCGVIAAAAASFKTRTTKSLAVSLILLPMIVETVIIMVNGNIGTGVAVMGAFSLVRFRSVPGKAKDIVSIFLVMTSGLACAAGYVGIALLFTLIVSAIMLIAMCIPSRCERASELTLTIPESLNFNDTFDDLFEEYTASHVLTRVKTTNMGSLFKLTYRIEMKNRRDMKEFIDKLRCRNGNLEISIHDDVMNSEEL